MPSEDGVYQVLVCSRINATHYESLVVADAMAGMPIYYGHLPLMMHRSDHVDWAAWRATYGGWDGAYARAVELFDMVVFAEGIDPETGDYFLGMGQATIGKGMLAANKPLASWREDIPITVEGIERIPGDNAQKWATPIVTWKEPPEDDTAKAEEPERTVQTL